MITLCILTLSTMFLLHAADEKNSNDNARLTQSLQEIVYQLNRMNGTLSEVKNTLDKNEYDKKYQEIEKYNRFALRNSQPLKKHKKD